MPNYAKYLDPAAKFIKDWEWKNLGEVAKKTPKAVPDYVQGGYGAFMQQQLNRAMKGELSPRDLIKAYTITQSSIGRGGLPHSTATKTGMKLPNTGGEVRPEGAYAEWLGSPMGQRYLDMASRGEVDPAVLADIQGKFAPFGKQNQLAGQMEYAAQNMPRMAENMNQAVTGDVNQYRDWAEQMKGIAGAKSGFIGSMLGRGDLPTFDARQIALHTDNQAPVGIGSIMNRGKGQGARESVDRLAARQSALDLDIDPSLQPHYQHLAHHAVWDALGDTQTTHDDIVRAMQNYAQGGEVRAFAGGGNKGKLIQAGLDAFKAMSEPEKTVKAYKLFQTKGNDPNTLYPLFVNAKKPVPMGQWIDAEVGELAKSGKVKSSIGELAPRPGWHAGDLPIATHIGGKSSPETMKNMPPDYRKPNQVWAEVEMPDVVDWQSEANRRAALYKNSNPETGAVAGEINPATAAITDAIPEGGYYRFKTNPNMTGNWMIGGSMKVNRVLSPEEVMAINEKAGVADLPPFSPLDLLKYYGNK